MDSVGGDFFENRINFAADEFAGSDFVFFRAWFAPGGPLGSVADKLRFAAFGFPDGDGALRAVDPFDEENSCEHSAEVCAVGDAGHEASWQDTHQCDQAFNHQEN